MAHTVLCIRCKAELPGLDFPPFPGELGQRIYESVSKQAWNEWLAYQTLLINENRLSPIEPKARIFLREAVEKFFFGTGTALPPGYRAPD